jgi:hypothetical protein
VGGDRVMNTSRDGFERCMIGPISKRAAAQPRPLEPANNRG